MRSARVLLATAAVTAVLSSAALAADVVVVPPPAPPAPPPVLAHNWSGPYIGIYGGVLFPPQTDQQICTASVGLLCQNAVTVGALMGYSLQFGGSFLAGVEVRTGLSWLWGGPEAQDVSNLLNNADINLRGGYIINDKILLYGVAGLGINWSQSLPYWNFGAGAEMRVGDRMTVFGEVRRNHELPGAGNDLLNTAILMGVTLHNN